MEALPPIRYTKIGSEAIAYRDLGGDGEILMYLGTNGSHQDLMWEDPASAHLLRTLASLGRLVTFDRRGSGLSSRIRQPTIEERAADIGAVLDAVGAANALLCASVGSSQAALAFAATSPHRCRALALYAPAARTRWKEDYPIGMPPEDIGTIIDATERLWGTGITARIYLPSLAHDRDVVAFVAKLERSLATPVEAREWVEMYDQTDVRDLLPHVHVPTLVVTPTDSGPYVAAWSRFVADALPNGRNVEVPASDQWPLGDGLAPFLAEVTGFLREIGEVGPVAASARRRLAAVMFTDLVGSTRQLHDVGDAQWRAVLDGHDDIVRRAVRRRGGTVVKTMGDGALAVFDGPASAVAAALDLLGTLPRLGLQARAGVHVGEIEERDADVAGIAVHVGSRIAALAKPGEVLVSSTVRDLVAGSGIEFVDRGTHEVKGVPQPLALLAASLDVHG